MQQIPDRARRLLLLAVVLFAVASGFGRHSDEKSGRAKPGAEEGIDP